MEGRDGEGEGGRGGRNGQGECEGMVEKDRIRERGVEKEIEGKREG